MFQIQTTRGDPDWFIARLEIRRIVDHYGLHSWKRPAPPEPKKKSSGSRKEVDSDLSQRQWLDTRQAAKYLGFSESHLRNLRWKGGGPKYSQPRRNVRYDVDDLDQWLSSLSLIHI